MLTESALAAMDRDQLQRYIGVLHEALGHVMGAAGEARSFVERNGGGASTTPSRNDMEEQLAVALAGSGK